MIKIEFDEAEVQGLFVRRRDAATYLRSLMQDLGEHLTETTKQRFVTSTRPDGTRWASIAESTYVRPADRCRQPCRTIRHPRAGGDPQPSRDTASRISPPSRCTQSNGCEAARPEREFRHPRPCGGNATGADELYLDSFRRSNAGELARARRRHEVVRE